MSRQGRDEKQPSPRKEKWWGKEVRAKLGPLEVEGPLGLVGSVFIGLLFGLLGGLALIWFGLQWQLPWLNDILIEPAVSATIAALPTATPVPTPTPSLMLRLFDASTEMPILPERGEYKLNPGQRVKIEVEPARENKMYKWTATPEDKFEPSRPAGPRVTFTVPEKHDQLTVVTVCELDEDLSCPGGRERSILIRATASEK